MCLWVYVCPCVWLQTHMPQHLCVAIRGQTWVWVLAFHILFVVWCCAHQAGWPRGPGLLSAFLSHYRRAGLPSIHLYVGSGYLNWGPPTQLKTLYLLSRFSTWNIYIYIYYEVKDKNHCFGLDVSPKFIVLETQSSKSSMQRCWEMRPNDPVAARSSWTGHCGCQGSR